MTIQYENIELKKHILKNTYHLNFEVENQAFYISLFRKNGKFEVSDIHHGMYQNKTNCPLCGLKFAYICKRLSPIKEQVFQEIIHLPDVRFQLLHVRC